MTGAEIGIVVDVFPRGIGHYLVGGVLIGIGVAVIYLATGRIPGASTVLESTLSYVSTRPRFQRYRASRRWRLVFTLGIVLGATGSMLLVSGERFVTEVQPWRLAVGGVLIGFGTRLGKGCTSGHGICGIGSMSTTSIANVAIFMSVAIGTALVVATAGVTP